MDCSGNTDPKETSGGSKDQETSSLNYFLKLPEDVTANILRRLCVNEILKNVQRVFSSWRNICKHPSMWRFIAMNYHGDYEYLDAMCRNVVDRSQGQLTDLCIDYFPTDELLNYISERSSKLRRLQLRGCDGVEDGLTEAVKKLPLLEELHFFDVIYVFDSIEPIGLSCLKLKSFTYMLSSSDYMPSPLVYEYDDCIGNFEALAIAKSMPGLRHLRLGGINMTNEGLEAILDGCPNLESLDIRRCFKVDLSGEIRDRIAQKIKDFKGPNDSMDDCEWDSINFYCPSDYSGGDSSDE